MRNRITAVAFVASLLPAASLCAQHTHEAGADRPPQVESTGAGPLSRLLMSGDQAVRAIELAAQGAEPSALAEAAGAYVSAMVSVEEYLEEAEPARITRDLSRLERALGRQRDRLQALADGSSPPPPAALVDALDASDRALDAVTTTRVVAPDPRADDHHGAGQRRRGCGHH